MQTTPSFKQRSKQAHSHAGVSAERGVALIMAMMIVALIAMVAVEVSWRFELSMSRSANRWHGIQARAYLEGAEHLAMIVLKEDLENEDTSKADHLGEPWAQQSEPFPTDHGWVSGRIEDAHGRFNINLMTPEPGSCPNGSPPQNGTCPPARTPCENYTKHQQIFVRLLQTFNLNQVQGRDQASDGVPAEEEPVYLPIDQAEQITDAVIDWLDANSEITRFGGAESDYYAGLETPITISNKEMVSVSELQVIRGMIPELYRQLLPFVIALPKEQFKQFNFNTISANLARSIQTENQNNCTLQPFDEEFGQNAAAFISDNKFEDWESVEAQGAIAPVEWLEGGAIKIPKDLFGFGPSEYFLLYSETGIGEDLVRRGLSLIRRSSERTPPGVPSAGQGPTIEVVRRSDANF